MGLNEFFDHMRDTQIEHDRQNDALKAMLLVWQKRMRSYKRSDKRLLELMQCATEVIEAMTGKPIQKEEQSDGQ